MKGKTASLKLHVWKKLMLQTHGKKCMKYETGGVRKILSNTRIMTWKMALET